jgi:hypothetical protein
LAFASTAQARRARRPHRTTEQVIACVALPPIVEITPGAVDHAQAGETLTFDVTVQNADTIECAPRDVLIEPGIAGGDCVDYLSLTSTLLVTANQLAPGEELRFQSTLATTPECPYEAGRDFYFDVPVIDPQTLTVLGADLVVVHVDSTL